MPDGTFVPPCPVNERVYNYAPGSPEAEALHSELKRMSQTVVDIPIIIGGKEIRSGERGEIRAPHNHKLLLATYYKASPATVTAAIDAAEKARKEWANLPWHARASVFLKAADLISTKYRPLLNAATMLGQSKSVYQAEIDSACELADFFRFNVYYMTEIYKRQPAANAAQVWNRVEYRPLEGFVYALTPFNFTSISGNLPTAPAVMGNTVVWKPASSAVLSNYYVMKLLQEAGLPDGVINFIPGDGAQIGPTVFNDPRFAGMHFTGSTATFRSIWLEVAENLSKGVYKSYPRMVGETGGKDFVFAHPNCNVRALAVALFRGAFEYQGQKCSAASRAYIPRSIWPQVKDLMNSFIDSAKMGDPADFSVFMGAVIDQKAFKNIASYIDYAKARPEEYTIVKGGTYDDSTGYFIHPTIIETTNPRGRLMEEEIFGPVLSVYVYDDAQVQETLRLVDTTSPFGLTGAIFANDRRDIQMMEDALRDCVGNFYINDKPTGAVVGQQPFGGARASGTNDKAGTELNLYRWVSERAIKESFIPAENWDYPHMH